MTGLNDISPKIRKLLTPFISIRITYSIAYITKFKFVSFNSFFKQKNIPKSPIRLHHTQLNPYKEKVVS